MLRITEIQHRHESTLRLEGKLLEPLLDELQNACRPMAATGQALTLDLAGLTYIDAPSTFALRELRERGIKFIGCSPLITELLKDNHP